MGVSHPLVKICNVSSRKTALEAPERKPDLMGVLGEDVRSRL